MELKYINPFIESVHELFDSMLGCRVDRKDATIVPKLESHRELVGVIGLSGPTRGNVALQFPEETALAMASRFIGEEMKVVDATVIDAIAELVNIVAGGAKAKLHDGETPIVLGLPNVIHAKGYTVHYPTTSVWLDIPLSSELGPFNMKLGFQVSNIAKEV
jgi:chemotaxis protein CheX